MNRRRTRWWLVPLTAAVLSAFLAAPARAEMPLSPDELRVKAEDARDHGRWLDACYYYDQVLKADPSSDAHEQFQLCLRRLSQQRRQRDPNFKAVLGRDLSEALNLYEEVLFHLQRVYVDRDKVQLQKLFQQGLQELRFALREEAFLQEHLRAVSLDRLREFEQQLDLWMNRDVGSLKDARLAAKSIANLGVQILDLGPTVTVLELVCGACTGLVEYSFFLTPSQLQYAQACLKGEHVGVGIKVAWADGKLLVAAVLPNSPALEKGLKPGDRITKIDGQPLDNVGADVIAARLLGRPGTTVELEILSPMLMDTVTVKLERRPVIAPSVEWESEPREGVGYVRILTFQENTPQEVREAVIQLRMARMKALVLDLRGNGGGHVRAAVQVAELFLREGMIAVTDSRVKGFKQEYRANNPSAWTMPLVVIVDGETASAAEILAGALKEHGRATLVGSPTFGKGTIQFPLPLGVESAPSGGIWVTVARSFSPTNQPYSGRGVTPHLIVPNDGDLQRTEAWRTAMSLTMMMPR